jgi:hypothetical protein
MDLLGLVVGGRLIVSSSCVSLTLRVAVLFFLYLLFELKTIVIVRDRCSHFSCVF